MFLHPTLLTPHSCWPVLNTFIQLVMALRHKFNTTQHCIIHWAKWSTIFFFLFTRCSTWWLSWLSFPRFCSQLSSDRFSHWARTKYLLTMYNDDGLNLRDQVWSKHFHFQHVYNFCGWQLKIHFAYIHRSLSSFRFSRLWMSWRFGLSSVVIVRCMSSHECLKKNCWSSIQYFSLISSQFLLSCRCWKMLSRIFAKFSWFRSTYVR